jgi:hypothetical protein
MQQIVGHSRIRSWLLQQYKKDELPSSLIFQGPPGVGKKSLAIAFLQWINCQHKTKAGACGECSDCRRVFEDQNELIYRLEPGGRRTIGVDQIREIHRFLTLRSIKPARFVIIDPADCLTTPAANALLKVLEESPERTTFFLITDQMRSLLPTIRSRSHILKFQELTPEEMCQVKDFSALALQWSGGHLPMARELEDESKMQQLNDSLRLLYSLLCEQPQDWKKLAPWFFNDDQAREFSFRIWSQALSKRLHQQGENLDWVPEHSGAIAQVYESIELLKRDIQGNVDKLLAVENFYYRNRAMELFQ